MVEDELKNLMVLEEFVMEVFDKRNSSTHPKELDRQVFYLMT